MATIFEIKEKQIHELCYQINRAAFGRIRQLTVRTDSGRLVLEGFASCFHDKQRAQEAAFSASQFIGPIANHIKVD
jgi:hypothetical protein